MKLGYYRHGWGYVISIKRVAYFHNLVDACISYNESNENYVPLKSRDAVFKEYKTMVTAHGNEFIPQEFYERYNEYEPFAIANVNKLFPELKGGKVDD